MNFKIKQYKGTKNRKLDFFNKENLIFANIENAKTFGIDLLLEGKKGEEKIILIGKKVISDVFSIIELPNGEEVIETELSDYGNFEDVYLTKDMEILKTNNGEIVTKIGESNSGLIEAEIQINLGKIGETLVKETIIGKLDKDTNFIKI